MDGKGRTGREENKIAVKFDRTKASGGVEVLCRLESGRALLEWRFHLVLYLEERAEKIVIPLETRESLPNTEEESIRLRLTDRQNNPVLDCVQFLREEEPLWSVLPQPQIWQGISNPCLYKAEAILADREGNCLDRIETALPLRQVECGNREGREEILLNGEVFEKRMVRYALPECANPVRRQRVILEDLELLRKLGANCLLLDASPGLSQGEVPLGEGRIRERQEGLQPEETDFFVRLCDRYGFLVFPARRDGGTSGVGDGIPAFRGIRESFFVPGRKEPTPLFYKYRAKWSREPFVYLVPESLKRLDNGNYTVCCYSSCGKVALYADGRLFGFRTGELIFPFYDIPCKKPTVMLTAEGEGCAHSLSIHKTFTKQSPNDDIFPIE